MIIDATFEEKNEVFDANFGILAKGDKGDKGDSWSYDDLSNEQKAEFRRDIGLTDLEMKFYLLQLANEGHTFAFVTDATNAQTKNVPSKSLPYAMLDKVGGSHVIVNNNLIPYPYHGIGQGETIVDDVSQSANIKDNGDGTIAVNGFWAKATALRLVDESQGIGLAAGSYKLSALASAVDAEMYYHFTAKKNGATILDFYAQNHDEHFEFSLDEDADAVIITLCLNSGGYSGEAFTPALLPSEKELTSIEGAPITAIKVNGKNLLPNEVNNLEKWYSVSDKKAYDLHFPCAGLYALSSNLLSDYIGVFNFYIQKASNGSFSSAKAIYDENGNAKSGYYITANDKEDGYDYGNTVYIKYEDGEKYRLYFYTPTPEKLDAIRELQLTKCDAYGDKNTDYAPHTEAIRAMPKELTSIEGYGLGINDTLFNHIDFENKTFVRMVALRDYEEGDENSETMVTDGFTTIYALDAAEIVDISSLVAFDNFIAVDGNGWITLVNEHGVDVPSTLTYQIKL